jgi:hypothetical protein
LTGLLKGINHELSCIWLGENACSDLFSTSLGSCGVRRAIRSEKELGIPRSRRPQEGITVSRGLRDWLAEAEGVACPGINDDGKVVGGYYDPNWLDLDG